MAEEGVLGLLFGVEGGKAIDKGSGKKIVEQLTGIVTAINDGGVIPPIKIEVNADDAAKQLKQNISDMRKMVDEIMDLQKEAKKKSNNDPSSDDKQSQKYKEQTKVIKDYFKEYVKGMKLVKESKEVIYDEKTNEFNTAENSRYKKRIDLINDLAKEYNKLNLKINHNPADGQSYIEAQKGDLQSLLTTLGLTNDEYTNLATVAKKAYASAAASVEKNSVSMNSKWSNASKNMSREVLDMYKTISKYPDVRKIADELLLMAQAPQGELQELKDKYDELWVVIKQTNADQETWGQKFAKAFGDHAKNALAGAVTGVITKAVHQLYQNVITLDEAVVNLQIASGKTREEVQGMIKDYANLGRSMGATTKEVADSADTWLRQGMSTSDANEMIRNTMMLSKLGQMESAEASRALTSAMKGYGVAVRDTTLIVDKFTAVDMEAAASAGDIATAMAETAASAKASGVSMDKLIGYIATVKEVTQDSSESVGTFYKTLFARMNNIKAGKFIDDETGEALNDVEAVLNKLKISLRDTNGQFRNSSEVLDEVAERWSTFDDEAQHAIATAFAGTRQQEKFLVLMQNYGSALQYTETAINSAGTATEKYGDYLDGIQSKFDSLTAAFEKLSVTILDSDLIKGVVEFATDIVDFLASSDGLPAKIMLISAAIVATVFSLSTLNAGLTKFNLITSNSWKSIKTFIGYLANTTAGQAAAAGATEAHTVALKKNLTTGIGGILTVIPRFLIALGMTAASHIKAKLAADASTASTLSLKAAMEALQINPVILAITAFITACTIAIAIAKELDSKWEEEYERAKKRAAESKELIEEYNSEIDALEALQQKLEDAKGNKQQLAKLYDDLNSKVSTSTGLLKGEEDAYKAVNAQLIFQINYLKQLRDQSVQDRISKNALAFKTQRAQAYGVNVFTQKPNLNADWAYPDIKGDVLRAMMRGDEVPDEYENRYRYILYQNQYPEDVVLASADMRLVKKEVNPLNYDIFYNQLNTEQQTWLLNQLGMTVDSWNTYWDNQVEIAKDTFNDVINNSSGAFNSEFMEMALDKLIRGGYTLEETDKILKELSDESNIVLEKIGEYESQLESEDDRAIKTYDELITLVDTYITKYPALKSNFESLFSVLSDPSGIGNSGDIPPIAREFVTILNGFKDEYEALAKAVKEAADNSGYLTAETVGKFLDEEEGYPALVEEYFQWTADGYKLADNALEKYISTQRSVYEEAAENAKEMYGENSDAHKVAVQELEYFNAAIKTLQVGEDSDPEINQFLEELDSLRQRYDALSNAIQDMQGQGRISADTLADILDPESGFPELEKYLQETTDGYIIAETALEEFITEQRRLIEASGDTEKLQRFNLALATITGQMKSATNAATALTNAISILQGGFNAIVSALDEVAEHGYITLNTLSSMLSSFPEMFQYLERTAQGFTITSDALDSWTDAKIQEQVKALANLVEGTDAYNAKRDEIIYAMMTRDMLKQEYAQKQAEAAAEAAEEAAKAANDAAKKAAEAEKDALQEQLDAYQELIDLRKELLESYSEEMSYQRELEKRQENVSKLQTKLALAKLDTSAAGQARVRQLESELKQAQDELDDFTLEHAIDVITKQLDEEYSQYETLINKKIDEVNSRIESLESAIDQVTGAINDFTIPTYNDYSNELAALLSAITSQRPPADNSGANGDDVDNGSGGFVAINGDADSNMYEDIDQYQCPVCGDYYGTQSAADACKNRHEVYYSRVEAERRESNHDEKTKANSTESTTKTYPCGVCGKPYLSQAAANNCAKRDKESDNDSYSFSRGGAAKGFSSSGVNVTLHKYHTGGFVGDVDLLRHDEEFAKLMEGEHVSTPAQVRNFMQRTLPAIASYTTSENSSNEFNAPLISIQCDTITKEALPRLETIVNRAVDKIQEQLDSGMSRSGRKSPAKKLLI